MAPAVDHLFAVSVRLLSVRADRRVPAAQRKKSELTEVLMRVVRASKSEVSHVPARLGLV